MKNQIKDPVFKTITLHVLISSIIKDGKYFISEKFIYNTLKRFNNNLLISKYYNYNFIYFSYNKKYKLKTNIHISKWLILNRKKSINNFKSFKILHLIEKIYTFKPPLSFKKIIKNYRTTINAPYKGTELQLLKLTISFLIENSSKKLSSKDLSNKLITEFELFLLNKNCKLIKNKNIFIKKLLDNNKFIKWN